MSADGAPVAADARAAAEAARHFALPGPVRRATRHGRGHIHETFAVTCQAAGVPRRFVLQRLNTRVFPDPQALVRNTAAVTAHLQASLKRSGRDRPERRVLQLVPARAGGFLHRDAAGGCWRATVRVEGVRTHRGPATPAVAEAAAAAYADFLRRLEDYPGPPLTEVLPGFHDTPLRLARFQQALAQDPLGRASLARRECDGALSRAALAGRLLALRRSGDAPWRIAHNDTKLDNVLFDTASGEGLCVVDLDTLMPGLALFDFGDLARSAASRASEDERDLARVDVDRRLFAALVRGWARGFGGLGAAERGRLVLAAQVITYEVALRFLTDFLEGDVYFKVRRRAHNLERARAQLALLRAFERREAQLRTVADREAT